MKNYNFGIHEAITLHSGNFLRMVQEYGTFVNHFLNILPKRVEEDWWKDSDLEDEDWDLDDYSPALNSTLNLILAYKGLAGGLSYHGRNVSPQANYLVVNAKNTGSETRFHVYSMSDIVKYIDTTDQGLEYQWNGLKPESIQNKWMHYDNVKHRYWRFKPRQLPRYRGASRTNNPKLGATHASENPSAAFSRSRNVVVDAAKLSLIVKLHRNALHI